MTVTELRRTPRGVLTSVPTDPIHAVRDWNEEFRHVNAVYLKTVEVGSPHHLESAVLMLADLVSRRPEGARTNFDDGPAAA